MSAEPTTSPLASPLRLPCGAVLANRIAKTATSEGLATEHMLPHEGHARLYGRWAAGGAGLLVTGNVMIDPSRRVARGDVALHAGSPRSPFTEWAQAANPAAIWMQLSHPGRQSPRALDRAPVAPSAVRLRTGIVVFATPRALSEDEIRGLVDAFAEGAARAKDAGFDGVQLHAAHGYLLHQFLSPRTNLRTDAWGGTPEKRRRLLLAVIAAVRSRVGGAFPIAVKTSAPLPDEPRAEGEAIDLSRALEDAGIDLIEITGGTYEHDLVLARRDGARDRREAYFAPFAERVRANVKVPLALTGGFRTPDAMARAVTSGLTDVVGLARPLIVDPDLPRRILAGERARHDVKVTPLGVKLTDAATELAWYVEQLRRLARGQDADFTLPRARALSAALRAFLP